MKTGIGTVCATIALFAAPMAAADVSSHCGPGGSGGECEARASEGPASAGSQAGSGQSESEGGFYAGPAPGLVEAFGGGSGRTGGSNGVEESSVLLLGAGGFAHQGSDAQADSSRASANAGAAQGNLANSNGASGSSNIESGEARSGAGAGSSQPVGAAGAGNQTDSRPGCTSNQTQTGAWYLIETGAEATTTTDRCGTAVQYRGPGG